VRRISAQYLFTSAGRPLKRGVITVADDGTVTGVEDTGGNLTETAGTEFYNGVVIPGFINCHAHLELSHMRDLIPAGGGLREFITSVRDLRAASEEEIISEAGRADREMHEGGVVACGDISNMTVTAAVKRNSRIRYMTFAEGFGLDPSLAETRMEGALKVVGEMSGQGLPVQVTPHSFYSVSAPLSQLISGHIMPDSVISVHFLESDDEREMTRGHAESALRLSGMASQVLLVHNTVISREEAQTVASAGNTWCCLCPSSNLHISGKMPPATMLREVTERIVVGTDSLASSGQLSMITELLLLQEAAPELSAEEIFRWGTLNGARSLKMDDYLGSIEPGKRPGLLLVEPFDLANLRLLPESRVRRLV